MIRLTRKRLSRNRYALATVVTTLIILVVAVLLAGVVTYFAINVVSTRVQTESVSISNCHIWVPATAATGPVEAAMMITNTGGRDVVISQIQVLGQPCTSIFYLYAVTTGKTPDDLDQGLAYTPANTGPTLTGVDVGTFANPLATSSGNLVLPSGETMVVYLLSPGSVSVYDIGLTVGLTVFTAQAMYYKETNVQAYTGP